MTDIVFCQGCEWFIRNEKTAKDTEGMDYRIDLATGVKFPNESYWECSHQSNVGKKIEWWGWYRYYKRKASQINAKNDCVRFKERRIIVKNDCGRFERKR